MEQEAAEYREEIDGLRGACQTSLEKLERAMEAMHVMQDGKQKLEARIQVLEEQREGLVADAAMGDSAAASLQEALEAALCERDSLKVRVDSLDFKLGVSEERRLATESHLEKWRSERSVLVARLDKAEVMLEEEREGQGAVRDACSRLQDEIAVLKAFADESSQNLKERNGRIRELEASVEAERTKRREERDGHREAMEDAESKHKASIEEMKEAFSEARREVREERSKAAGLEELRAALEGELQRLLKEFGDVKASVGQSQSTQLQKSEEVEAEHRAMMDRVESRCEARIAEVEAEHRAMMEEAESKHGRMMNETRGEVARAKRELEEARERLEEAREEVEEAKRETEEAREEAERRRKEAESWKEEVGFDHSCLDKNFGSRGLGLRVQEEVRFDHSPQVHPRPRH